MENEIFLTSEKMVKKVTSISDNIAGKYLFPSVREAQDIYLRGILGDELLQRCKRAVVEGGAGSFDFSFDNSFSVTEADTAYKQLVNRCQYYLVYQTCVMLCEKVQFKIANVGVVKTTDENIVGSSETEFTEVRSFFQSKADFYGRDLQGFLLDNRAYYPELSDNRCHQIRANLMSQFTSGLALGGARGRKLPRI